MTAHPKYYSFVGLVAPADRKAVYMGYAFLYGVFGSLLGSNLGAFLYARMLKPVIGTPDAVATTRDLLADVRGARRRRGGRPDPVRPRVHGRHAARRGARPAPS